MGNPVHIIHLNSQASEEYFRQVARIHSEEIRSGFLPQLGMNFLVKLYKCISSSAHAFLFAAVHNDQIVGFICGSTNTKKLYSEFFLRYGPQVFPLILPKLMNFNNIKRGFETLLYPDKKESLDLPRSEILNFCVSHRFQRMGIGKKLFFELIEEFRRREMHSIKIVTGFNQQSAQRFYEALGAQLLTHIEVHQGVSSALYTYRILENTSL